jgi:hypothetical protein
MTFDAPTPDPERAIDPDMPASPPSFPGSDIGQAGTTPPTNSQEPLVLSGRDRFAVRLIDAAVKIGSDDFQARYRPVTEELFSHHFIDPKAKPAYVPPPLEPIVNLDTTEDPLEIIRLHLDSVIEDRQTRDEARINAEAHLADVSGQLAESQALAADLQQQLAFQTSRAEAAETEVSRLRAELQNQVSALTAQRESEVASLHQQREAEVANLHQQREVELGELSTRLTADLAALSAQRDADVNALNEQRENEVASITTQRDTQVAELQSRLNSEIAAVQNQRDNEIAILRSERDATVAGLHAQRETEVAALTAELAELRAQRDAQVAELTTRLESQAAELDGTRTSDVNALAAEHDSQLEAIHATHEQQLAELTAAHEQQVAELATTHEQHISDLIAEKDSLAAQLQAEPGTADDDLTTAREELAAAVARAEQATSELDTSRAEIESLRAERDRSDAQRDAAIEELDGVAAQRGEWENRLRITVAALATTDDVGDWTDDNAPDERLVDFVRSTTSALEQKITRIEQIATEELVDENETNDYAIGANDAAVRILNALDDVEADSE